GAASSQSGSVTLPPSVTDKKQLKATAGAGCDDVTDKTPPARKGTGKAKATPHDETDREEF
ncbi:hypothetical protein JTL70_34880, partial [Pseudomonas aeruginosa]|nr:hypothetical protein [Pseudomonas aeruginosa]